MSFAISEILEDFVETSSLPQPRRVHRDDSLFDDSRSFYSEERWRREALKIKLLFSFSSSPPPSVTRSTCDRCGGVLERREGTRSLVHIELRSHPQSRHCAYARGA